MSPKAPVNSHNNIHVALPHFGEEPTEPPGDVLIFFLGRLLVRRLHDQYQTQDRCSVTRRVSWDEAATRA